MFNTNFNLKKNEKLDNERPINLVARWSHKRKLVYATGEKILPKYFETEKNKKLSQRAKTCFIGYAEFNTRLDYIEATAKDAFRKFGLCLNIATIFDFTLPKGYVMREQTNRDTKEQWTLAVTKDETLE